jgi:hypothetical protein
LIRFWIADDSQAGNPPANHSERECNAIIVRRGAAVARRLARVEQNPTKPPETEAVIENSAGFRGAGISGRKGCFRRDVLSPAGRVKDRWDWATPLA